uniref:Uncharacterized protein n=1 Tax=Micrurus spixii TaxID=129469 RepID=A0A2D4LXN5_9SAUR
MRILSTQGNCYCDGLEQNIRAWWMHAPLGASSILPILIPRTCRGCLAVSAEEKHLAVSPKGKGGETMPLFTTYGLQFPEFLSQHASGILGVEVHNPLLP